MTRPDLTCKELVELVTDYLEEMLEEEDRQRFEEHLSECAGCHTYVEQMRQTIRITRRLTEDEIPTPAKDSLLQAFRHWKQEQ
jgi:anti-sigma factor RsiW